jgi:hypothetical protein
MRLLLRVKKRVKLHLIEWGCYMGKVRSTRNKIQWQMRKIHEHVTHSLINLDYLEELAGGRSPVVNEYVPSLKILFGETEAIIRKLRDML